MKRIHKYVKIEIAFLVALCVGACSDAWESHYEPQGPLSTDKTLWTLLNEEPQLTDFVQVLKATGFESVLLSPTFMTVWAPVNGTFDADSLIAMYRQQKASGVKDNENGVVVQFIRNHIALYNHPVSSVTADSVYMLNGKYQTLTSTAFGSAAFYTKNQTARNGLLYVVSKSQPYFYNLYEYLRKEPQLSTLAGYLSQFDSYAFNAEQSVAGGVVDGQTVYLDSVVYNVNERLEEIGFLNCEDSTYWMMAITNDCWAETYQAISPYFVYPTQLSARDSLQDALIGRAITDNLVFNENLQRSATDSLCSTQYQFNRKASYGLHVFYRPFDVGGILEGAQEVTCSNGRLYIQKEYRMDPYATFFKPIVLEAEREVGREGTLCEFFTRTVIDNPLFELSNDRFMEAQPSNTSANPSIVFTIPNTLAGSYDIYCVFAPEKAYNKRATGTLPTKVKFTLTYPKADGTIGTILAKSPANTTAFITNPEIMDTVLVASDFQYPVCNYGLNNTAATLKVQTNISSKETTLYTRVLRLDCILLKPHRTEE